MLVTSLNPLAQPSADSVGQALSEPRLQPCRELRLWIFALRAGFNGYMSNILSAGATTHESPGTTRQRRRSGREEKRGEEDDLCRLNVNTWWVDSRPGRADPSGLESCNQMSDESVPCHSCYQTVRQLTKKAFKRISNTGMKPRCLASITPIKNSQRRKPVQLSAWAHSLACFFFPPPPPPPPSLPLPNSAAFATSWADMGYGFHKSLLSHAEVRSLCGILSGGSESTSKSKNWFTSSSHSFFPHLV